MPISLCMSASSAPYAHPNWHWQTSANSSSSELQHLSNYSVPHHPKVMNYSIQKIDGFLSCYFGGNIRVYWLHYAIFTMVSRHFKRPPINNSPYTLFSHKMFLIKVIWSASCICIGNNIYPVNMYGQRILSGCHVLSIRSVDPVLDFEAPLQGAACR